MLRTMLNGKIHRATITGADLDSIGSITVDALLLAAANIRPYERVQVVDITNGARLETYAVLGERGSGEVRLNGAAAHLVNTGDRVIIMSYTQVEDPVPPNWQPRIVFVDERNAITDIHALARTGEPRTF